MKKKEGNSDSKYRAVMLIVEMFKLEIAISLAFSTMSLTLFTNKNRPFTYTEFLISGLVLFLLAVIFSLLTISRLITQIYEEDIDIYMWSVRITSFLAIALFLIGCILFFMYLYYNWQ